jgi:hypothetical protein
MTLADTLPGSASLWTLRRRDVKPSAGTAVVPVTAVSLTFAAASASINGASVLCSPLRQLLLLLLLLLLL